MMEFIDKEVIVYAMMMLGTIFLTVSLIYTHKSKKRDSTHPKYTKYLYLLITLLPVFAAFYNENLALENIKDVNNGKSLKCRDDESLYLVSKKNNWIIDGIYFTKDSLLIRADNCKRRE